MCLSQVKINSKTSLAKLHKWHQQTLVTAAASYSLWRFALSKPAITMCVCTSVHFFAIAAVNKALQLQQQRFRLLAVLCSPNWNHQALLLVTLHSWMGESLSCSLLMAFPCFSAMPLTSSSQAAPLILFSLKNIGVLLAR